MNLVLVKSVPIILVIFSVFLQNIFKSSYSKEIVLLIPYILIYCALVVQKPYMNMIFFFIIGFFLDAINGLYMGFSSVLLLINFVLIKYEETTFKINNNILSLFILFLVNTLIVVVMVNILNIFIDINFFNSLDIIIKYVMLFVIFMPLFFLIYKVIMS